MTSYDVLFVGHFVRDGVGVMVWGHERVYRNWISHRTPSESIDRIGQSAPATVGSAVRTDERLPTDFRLDENWNKADCVWNDPVQQTRLEYPLSSNGENNVRIEIAFETSHHGPHSGPYLAEIRNPSHGHL